MRRNSLISVQSELETGIENIPIGTIIVIESSGDVFVKKYMGEATTIFDGLNDGSIESVGGGDKFSIKTLLKIDGMGSGLDADLVRGLPADFEKESSGKRITQHSPSGLILQTGSVSKKVGSGKSTHKFNTPFENECNTVLVMQYDYKMVNIGYILRLVSFSTIGFTVTEEMFNGQGKDSVSSFVWMAYGS
jgi:hypothetical protein